MPTSRDKRILDALDRMKSRLDTMMDTIMDIMMKTLQAAIQQGLISQTPPPQLGSPATVTQ